MASRRNLLRTKAGFTLLELMLVVALVAMLGVVGVYFGIDAYRGYAFHTDRDLLASSLQHARAQAIGNICIEVSGSPCDDGKPHGVAVTGNSFVIFQGATYATRDVNADVVMQLNPSIVRVPANFEASFSQLAATSTGGTLTLTDVTGRTSSITVGSEGQVIWTN